MLDKLEAHYKKLISLDSFEAMEEQDCIDHFFGAGGLEAYTFVRAFSLANGYGSVYDIGCAYGHQSELFIDDPIAYIGIDRCRVNFWNAGLYEYIVRAYPFEVANTNRSLAVSRLCIGYEASSEDSYKQLATDFKHALIQCGPLDAQRIARYYNHCSLMEYGFYFYER